MNLLSQNLKPIVLLINVLSISISFALSQDLVIKGKLIDSTTHEPIPYASIGIQNSLYGTATDEAGIFHLKVKHADRDGILKISSVGYNSAFFSIDSLSKVGEVVLHSVPGSVVLHAVEVTTKPINPTEIIKMALDSIVTNYRQENFNLIFYSVLDCKSILLNTHYKIESIINGYYDGYSSVAKKRFEIVRKRSFGENPLKVADYPFWPTLELHRADLIADPALTGIFNKRNLDQFSFQYQGVTTFDMDTVYKISYHAPNPTAKLTGYATKRKFYKGIVYITTRNAAIVKHEIETDQFYNIIIYRKFGNEYFPYLLRGVRTQTGTGSMTNITNLIRLLYIELDQINKLDYKTNEFDNLSSLPEDNSFDIDKQ
ncbi:MAG: carboxypeptidase-like regulatory domain-containing protein [Cyclobacteriaceae bacterium]|nr:carboxypeptidase-like regulatory domain-containing protein [Cyclobacteriaceae bacterium]